MRERLLSAKWLLVTLCCISGSVNGENQPASWSKPEKSISAENNDWIPVQGKCPTCRPSRDLDAQATNEQINQVLSPPAPSPSRLPNLLPNPQPTQKQLIQFPTNKQPRILPFGSNFPPFNNPFINGDNKPYQLQSTKLYAPEPQKQFYQYETNNFVKQPFSLPPQQLIQPASTIIQQQIPQQQIPQQQILQQQIPQQRFPVGEPYPFTLPLKPADTTTPKVAYQPKIRFPDVEIPKYIPNNKITAQNTEEIQLLYVPVETLQRGRKNMKEQFPTNIPPAYLASQYNLQYPSFPSQADSQYLFPQGYSIAPNFIQPQQPQIQQLPLQQKLPETVPTNVSNNVLQPYFTINGIYNSASPIPANSIKQQQADLQLYNLLQAGLINPNQLKPPEQQFKSPGAQIQPGQYEFNSNAALPQPDKTFVLQSNPELSNVQPIYNDVYTPTTTEAAKTTQLVTEKSTFANKLPTTKVREFEYQYVTSNPQTSASQNQQYVFEQNVLTQPKPAPQSVIPPRVPQSKPTAAGTAAYQENNANYPVPHQPPLSFYMEKLHNSKVNDVLYLLKDARTIPVLDSVENEPPQVFVGPSELQPPKGYIKFELPYLSSLDYNRIERMIDKLPFFVAPLNFKPPPGYSKIPFPAPHIGSVVLSNSTAVHEALHGKPYEQKYKPTITPQIPSTELSTNNPQLTSQINSLVDTPSSALANTFSFQNAAVVPPSNAIDQTIQTYPTPAEEVPRKSPPKTSYYKPTTPTVTEPPKRVTYRQRRPIYRGYPTTQETTTNQYTTTEATKSIPAHTKDNDNYVEFSAKGTFNVNEGRPKFTPPRPSTPIDNTFQAQVPSTTVQPPTVESDKAFDISNFFSTYKNQPSPPTQNTQFPNTQFPNTQFPNTQFPNTQFQNQAPTSNSQFSNTQSQNQAPTSNSPFPNTQFQNQAPTSHSQFQANSQPPANTQTQSTQFQNVERANTPPQFVTQFQPSQFENSQPISNQPSQTFNSFPENSFHTSKQHSHDYFNPNGQTYPFFNPQTTSESKSESSSSGQINATQLNEINQPSVNFNSIKPLSQYDPFSKNGDATVNITEPAVISSISSSSTSSSSSSSSSHDGSNDNNNNNNQQNTSNLSFWNTQSQFYNANPAAVEFFSSPASFPTAENAASVSDSVTKSTTSTSPATTASTSTTYAPEYDIQDSLRIGPSNSDSTSTEATEKPTTNAYRSRIKQRIHPNRYHQSKYTTEREPTDYQSVRTAGTTTKPPATDYAEPSSQSDSDTSSTEPQPETTTKHRRRRPNKPHQHSVAETSTIGSTRGYRTRPTRYPGASSSTERYRARRPTTNAETTSEAASPDWVGYGTNNFPPSAPAANEITASSDAMPRTNNFDETSNVYAKPVSTQYWSESKDQQQRLDDVASSNASASDGGKNVVTENYVQPPSWSEEPPKESSYPEYSSFVGPTAQSQPFLVEDLAAQNKSENLVERKDEHQFVDASKHQQTVADGPSQTQIFEEIGSTSENANHKDSVAESSIYPGEKISDQQEIHKEKFLSKEGVLDGQKKAHDPRDEKKIPGRRRGTWVRRIRIKRPQDVFETAESQNLGRLSENSLQTADSKSLSKTEEKSKDKDGFVYKFKSNAGVSDDIVASTEAPVVEKDETRTTTTENNEYANLQSNFAQMLSDFLNNNDQSTKTVNNIERYNSTENSISFVLGLDKQEQKENSNNNNSSANTFVTNSPIETTTVSHIEDNATIMNYPSATETFEHQTTTDESSETVAPNKYLGTSTTTEISLETEICYRGKCVKTKKSKASDLLPVE